MPNPEPIYFSKPTELRRWLQRYHDKLDEQWIGFYKKGTGIASITWPESVDEALCFGWIDGQRKSINAQRYKIRFTPRRPDSHWSARNLARIEELLAAGRVTASGLAIYEQRSRKREKQASYEQGDVGLPARIERRIKENKAAWTYWRNARPSYRKQVSWWIVSAKKEETRLRRLRILIEASAEGDVIPALRWGEKN